MNITICLEAYLLVAAILFSIGLYGALSRKDSIRVLMSLEIMAIAVNLNLAAFSRFLTPLTQDGMFFAIFSMVVSAAEIGLGLGLVVAIYRRLRTSELSDIDELWG